MALASVILAVTGFFESSSRYEPTLFWIDIVTTVFFTVEYGLRIIIADRKWKYVLSPMGLIDFISFVPTYLGFGNFGFLKAARFIRIARLSRVANLSNMPKVIPKKGDNESA
jgi:voltage-gated potassium channel